MDDLQTLVSSLQVALELQQRENLSLREQLGLLKHKLAVFESTLSTGTTLPSPATSRSKLNAMRDSLKISRSRTSSPASSLPGTPRNSATIPSAGNSPLGLISRLRLELPRQTAFSPSAQPKAFSARSNYAPAPTVFRNGDETKTIDRMMERKGYLRKFEKIGPGSYRYGARRVFVTLRNDRLLVRDGNAFVHIEHFANL